jgi:hypothetical protein
VKTVSGAALYEFPNLCQKDLAGLNLPYFRHHFFDNIRASALKLDKMPQWPVTERINASVEN